ncbi:MAG: tRNA (adenosine(37)-N6)-threonylcarbamoyltransferase complex dimerization subunit type 1 TsaB [Ruminococcus sp.]|nr:tRNA (adenosine(37)-N6)-threonylcarbamoyltransferase complex dimerization subunit type 1 TsaB [Ruminococcus sp.]
MEDLLLLGIDTSGKTASAALFDTEKGVFLAQKTLYTQKTHSQVIMPICKEIISQTEHEIADIGAIAVANGPGSYTGLRIGAAAVKAMCFALSCKCCGVSTLEGLACNNIAFRGIICAVMKARGELVYVGIYRSSGNAVSPIHEEQIMERSRLSEILSDYGEEILLCGDAACDFYNDFPSEKLSVAPQNGLIQNAAGICLAALNKEFTAPDELEVSYLQKVKAEKDLEEKSKPNQ